RAARRKGVTSWEAPLPQETKHVAANVIGAGFRNHVHYATSRPAELGRERIGYHLKLPHRRLAHSRTRSVNGVVCVVGAVNLYEVGAATLTAKIQTGSWSRTNRSAVVAADC